LTTFFKIEKRGKKFKKNVTKRKKRDLNKKRKKTFITSMPYTVGYTSCDCGQLSMQIL